MKARGDWLILHGCFAAEGASCACSPPVASLCRGIPASERFFALGARLAARCSLAFSGLGCFGGFGSNCRTISAALGHALHVCALCPHAAPAISTSTNMIVFTSRLLIKFRGVYDAVSLFCISSTLHLRVSPARQTLSASMTNSYPARAVSTNSSKQWQA